MSIPSLLHTITAQYLIYAFLASLGVLQLAAVRSGARRFWLLSGERASLVAGMLLIVGAHAYFYLQAPYGQPGLEGAELFFNFAGAAFAAVLVAVLAGAVRSGRIGGIRRSLRRRSRDAAAELRPLWRGTPRAQLEDEAR